MTTVMYEKLFEPYTSDGHTLEATIKYLTNLASQKGVANDVLELAINEIFVEIANGREFSKTKCSCGCGIDKAATDLIHTIRDRMFAVDKERIIVVKELLQKRYQLLIVDEMKRLSNFNKERANLIKGTLWERLTDWPTSRIYCLIKGQDVNKNRIQSRLARIKKYAGK